MSQDYVKEKAEMLLANFDSHSRGVKGRIIDMLVNSGLSEQQLLYYARYKRWPTSRGDDVLDPTYETFDNFADVDMKRRMARRKRYAIRNIIVFGSLVFAIFLFLSIMIVGVNESKKTAVDPISIEETTSSVKDGDAL